MTSSSDCHNVTSSSDCHIVGEINHVRSFQISADFSWHWSPGAIFDSVEGSCYTRPPRKCALETQSVFHCPSQVRGEKYSTKPEFIKKYCLQVDFTKFYWIFINIMIMLLSLSVERQSRFVVTNYYYYYYYIIITAHLANVKCIMSEACYAWRWYIM